MTHSPIRAVRRQQGFTLIELVCAIVLLAILSAVALPKLIELGADARLASVNGLAGAVRTAASNAYAMCLVKDSKCGYLVLGTVSVTAPNGVQGKLFNGYPSALLTAGFSHISHWVTYTGFTMDTSVASVVVFSLPTAPVPADCSVTYSAVGIYGNVPVITTATSGC